MTDDGSRCLDLGTLCAFGAHLPWTLGSPPVAEPGPPGPAVEAAVRHALAGARGPVGIALSGGIDSTVVAAAAVRAGARPRVFALDTGRAAEEARAVASALGLALELIPLPPGGIRGTSPAAVVGALGRPTHSGAPFGFLPLYRALAARGIGTVLTGDGADEAFAGHDYHRRPPMAWADDIWSTWRAVRGLGVDERALLVDPGPPWVESPAARRVAAEVAAIEGSAARLRWLDVRLRQGPQCVDLQRALAEACGLAYRAPLADRRVTARALAAPLDPARPKAPLVALAEGWLGRPWRRVKQPMHTPTGGAALGDDWLRWLDDSMTRRWGVFRPAAVARWVAEVDPAANWLPRAVVIVATTHAGLAGGVFARGAIGGGSTRSA